MATLLALLACRLIATVSSSPPVLQGEAEFDAFWYQLVGQTLRNSQCSFHSLLCRFRVRNAGIKSHTHLHLGRFA